MTDRPKMCGKCGERTHKYIDCPYVPNMRMTKIQWKKICWAKQLADDWYKERYETTWDDMAERLMKIRKHLK